MNPYLHLALCPMGIRVNFVTNLGDLYQNKLWGICNLSSASGPNDDVIKMAAKLMHI